MFVFYLAGQVKVVKPHLKVREAIPYQTSIFFNIVRGGGGGGGGQPMFENVVANVV